MWGRREYTVLIWQRAVIVEVKVQSGPNSKNYKIGGDITIGWRTHHGLALT